MEKFTTDAPLTVETARPQRRDSALRRGAVAVALTIPILLILRIANRLWFPHDGSQPHIYRHFEGFDWDNIPTKPYLDYVPCWEDPSFPVKFQCARLELRMDYWNGTTNATISLAVMRKPAVVPVTHPQYGGAIVLNPGGPGGSGIGFLYGAGEPIRQVVDVDDLAEDGKHFDIISFDPRGVGLSEPTIQCYNSSWPVGLLIWNARMYEEGVFSSSDAAFGRIWSMTKADANGCSLPPDDGSPDIKEYVSTAYVATDMLELVERHGEWREKEAKRELASCSSCSRANKHKGGVKIPEALKWKKGKEKLQYWGFSYGSYLGNTFAAMYPERVDRLIVDGVVDAEDYKKALWSDNLVDTELDLGTFYSNCARVGYPICALGNENGTTTEDSVRERIESILAGLYHNPLPIISRDLPGVIMYSDMKYLLFVALYSPLGSFEVVAKVLAAVESGDIHYLGTPEVAGIIEVAALRLGRIGLNGDATGAIACSDGDSQQGTTKEQFGEHIRNLTAISPSVGEIWSILRLQCIHYSVRAHVRFDRAWEAETSHPILEIGNTADPVTPGRYAKKMAKGFKGAGVLIQDSAGHCSISAPSVCTQGYVRLYFQTGRLPPPDTVCPVDALPFGPTPGEVSIRTAEVQAATERHERIVKAFNAVRGGYMMPGYGLLLDYE